MIPTILSSEMMIKEKFISIFLGQAAGRLFGFRLFDIFGRAFRGWGGGLVYWDNLHTQIADLAQTQPGKFWNRFAHLPKNILD